MELVEVEVEIDAEVEVEVKLKVQVKVLEVIVLLTFVLHYYGICILNLGSFWKKLIWYC